MQFKFLPVLALVFGLASTAIASAIPSPGTVSATFASHALEARDSDVVFTEADAASLEEAFTTISAIPDTVLEAGDLALDRYLINAGVRSPKALVNSLQGDAVSCAVEIGKFIVSNVFLAAKILRIKKYIDALGGAAKAAQLLLKATTPAQRLKIGGEALRNLFNEISGAKKVVDACT
ncbi:hypothetical protein BJ508DRAFT_381520 [Ascobolus immersus RN42]|uniref:Cell wall protein n=1 Tax=Ascobolus immersus RN42 TaxID=1160509 RepID=A0A3N4HK49_ASCIM|nr:hypothetical protein BJ508DRAFT_381520 [Ascobolus immersus RN42]